MSTYIHVRSTFTLYPEPITGYHLNEYGSNRARHSPPPTPEEDDDKGQVQVNDTDTTRGNIGDVTEKGAALPTPHLWSNSTSYSCSYSYSYSYLSFSLLSAPQSSFVVGRSLTHPFSSLPTGEVGAFGCEATDDTFSVWVMIIKVPNRGFDPCK